MAYRLRNPSFTQILSALLCTTFLSCASAYADDPPTFDVVDPGFGPFSYATNISADGTTVIGYSYIGGFTVQHAFILKNGVYTDLGTLGGNRSAASGISSNGSVVSGASYITGNTDYHAFRWENGVIQDLGTLGGRNSYGTYLSANGAVIAGQSDLTGNLVAHSFRWTAGVMTDLGTLGGSNSGTGALSADGSSVAGFSQLTGDVGTHAFRWKSGVMTDLGSLGGASFGRNISANGDVVVGDSLTTGNAERHAFRWESGTMTDLGTLGGTQSNAEFISANGSVVAGYSTTVGEAEQFAYRWENGVMTSLGALEMGGIFSKVGAMSANGNVIVGSADDSNNNERYFYRWTQDTGMQSFEHILNDANVDFSGWILMDLDAGPMAISADGKYVTATGLYQGDDKSFIFSLAVPGITTPAGVVESLHTVTIAQQQAASATTQQIGQTLFMARHINSLAIISQPSYSTIDTPLTYGDNDVASFGDISPAAGGDEPAPMHARRGIALYTLGGVGFGQNNDFNNHDINGTVGIDLHLSDSFNFGVGVLGAQSKTELAFDGNAKTDARGVSSILSYEPEHFGLRLYGAAFWADLSSDRTRGYTNGAGLDFSRGKTDGTAYGGAMQVGWQFRTSEKSAFMPYAELQASKTKMDAYTETGGAFPGSFSDQSSTSLTSHIGVEQKYDLTSHVNLLGRVAWGHRLDDGDNSFTGTSAGLTQSLGSGDGDQNWAEATVGVGWQASEKLHLNAEVSGRSGNTSEPAVNLTFGASYAF